MPHIVSALLAAGFEIDVARTIGSSIEGDLEAYELVLLDSVGPGLSSTEACRRIRERSSVPLLIVTGSGAEVERVLGLEAGADDCVSRPASGDVVVACVRAILRRRELNLRVEQCTTQRVGNFQLDLSAQTASLDGRGVELTPTEFRLLALLVGEPGRVHSRREIVGRLWRSSHTGDERACDGHVKNLRRKIEHDPARPRYLVTVRGVGYMLRPD